MPLTAAASGATTVGPLMEYLVSALPDPGAHGVAIRLLGATFVNDTMTAEDAGGRDWWIVLATSSHGIRTLAS